MMCLEVAYLLFPRFDISKHSFWQAVCSVLARGYALRFTWLAFSSTTGRCLTGTDALS